MSPDKTNATEVIIRFGPIVEAVRTTMTNDPPERRTQPGDDDFIHVRLWIGDEAPDAELVDALALSLYDVSAAIRQDSDFHRHILRTTQAAVTAARTPTPDHAPKEGEL